MNKQGKNEYKLTSADLSTLYELVYYQREEAREAGNKDGTAYWDKLLKKLEEQQV